MTNDDVTFILITRTAQHIINEQEKVRVQYVELHRNDELIFSLRDTNQCPRSFHHDLTYFTSDDILGWIVAGKGKWSKVTKVVFHQDDHDIWYDGYDTSDKIVTGGLITGHIQTMLSIVPRTSPQGIHTSDLEKWR